ncbi:speckle-type POZ protein-like [Ornithodoros turicata]|uniref:speckle-type POZ protein-like n=1 Tax=Ornithodoros turicata TaxID=34597 RepID=UPI00313A3708
MAALARDSDFVSCSYSYHEYKAIKCLHKWVIRDFKVIGDTSDCYIDSGMFFNGHTSSRQWSMRLYPAMVTPYITYLQVDVMFHGSAAKAAFCIWVVNNDNKKVKEQVRAAQSCSKGIVWSVNLGKRSEFVNNSRYLVPDDVLTLCCELTIFYRWQSSAACTVENPPRPGFSSLFQDGDFTIVALTAQGKEIKVHKNVLAMCSPVFNAMFKNNMMEKRENRVDLRDISARVLQEIVTFMYTDTAPNIASLAADLLYAAEKYDLKRLKSMCEHRLASSLTVDNAVHVLHLAVKLKADQLRDFAVCYIKTHAVDVGKTDGWKALTEEETGLLELLLSSGAREN